MAEQIKDKLERYRTARNRKEVVKLPQWELKYLECARGQLSKSKNSKQYPEYLDTSSMARWGKTHIRPRAFSASMI